MVKNFTKVTQENIKLGDRVKSLVSEEVFLVVTIYKDGARFLREDSQSRSSWSWDGISGLEFVHYAKETVDEIISNVEQTRQERAAILDIRYTQLRDRLEDLDYKRIDSNSLTLPNTDGIVRNYHVYVRPEDGSRIILQLDLAGDELKIEDINVFQEVSTSNDWRTYFNSFS